MIKYTTKFYLKDTEILYYFLTFFKRSYITQSSQIFFNVLRKKKSKKIVSVLKSPHVNKTAQEHFGFSIYTVEISCYSWDIKKYLVILKQIKNLLFSGVQIKTSSKFLAKQKDYNFALFNPIYTKFYFFIFNFPKQKIKNKLLNLNMCTQNKILLPKILLYLNVLDCYGN